MVLHKIKLLVFKTSRNFECATYRSGFPLISQAQFTTKLVWSDRALT